MNQFKFLFTLIIILNGLQFTFSQSNGFETIQYNIASNVHYENSTGKVQKVFETNINIPNAISIRIAYSDFYLGTESFLRVFSQQDEAEYDFSENMIRNFNNTSPYFNGGDITISLFHHPNDVGIFFVIDSILILNPETCLTTGICGGVDDRVKDETEYKAAIGRLFGNGTAWITSTYKIVTANHVYESNPAPGWTRIIEFNVPESYNNGNPKMANVEDQYLVIGVKAQGGATLGDDDWAILNVRPNYAGNNNYYYPWDKQDKTIDIRQNFQNGTDMRVSGYGCTNYPLLYLNFALSTATGNGSYHNQYGEYVRYAVDISGGDSGGPIIDLETGCAVGIVIFDGCSELGYNTGLSFHKQNLWNALEGNKRYTTVLQRLSDASTTIGYILVESIYSAIRSENPGCKIAA